ncbi:MAG: hypothetical protein ACWA49_16120 [Ruegeria sp.]
MLRSIVSVDIEFCCSQALACETGILSGLPTFATATFAVTLATATFAAATFAVAVTTAFSGFSIPMTWVSSAFARFVPTVAGLAASANWVVIAVARVVIAAAVAGVVISTATSKVVTSIAGT